MKEEFDQSQMFLKDLYINKFMADSDRSFMGDQIIWKFLLRIYI